MKRNALAHSLAPVILTLVLLASGSEASDTNETPPAAEANPPASGFLAEESDPEAIALADQVMARLGGRSAWDATRFVTWKFFGNRFHVWDRHTGDIRVEGTDRETQEPYTILMNLHSKEGRAWRAEAEVTDPEELSKMLELGESAWINDAYWMFMPYKLKDTGVALEYRGDGALLDGRTAEVLELTFREVGRTPENKYLVYVAKDTGLVEQWDFFTNAGDEEPRFRVPWRNWRRYGSILLSDDRGRGRHTGIAVFDSLPETVFTEPGPVDLGARETADSGSPGGPVEAPIYRVEGDVVRPQSKHKVPPEYSESARKERVTGQVVVRAVIGPDGAIRDAWITEPLEESLDESALQAVRQWTFEPATLNETPVSVYYDLTINYELDGDASKSEPTDDANRSDSR